jgi:hypothetical protein
MDATNIIEIIERAFTGLDWSETSMRQFVLTDKFGMTRPITDAEWNQAGRNRVDKTWMEIPDSEIEECDVQLSHMMNNEFVYFLPAYMRYSLKHYPNDREFVLGSTIFSLSAGSKEGELSIFKTSKFDCLNDVQKSAVAEYLRFIAGLDDPIHSEDANAALISYWNDPKQISIY